MTTQEYEIWWPLHRRRSLGEVLNEHEQRLYDAGLRQLDAAETYPVTHQRLLEMRELLEEMNQRRIENQTLEKTLQNEIAALETEYEEITGQRLIAAA